MGLVATLSSFAARIRRRIGRSDVATRLARGTFWSLAGAVVSRAFAVVASVFTARLLGAAGFGELGILNSTLGMFGPLAGFQMGFAATKYVAELRQSDPARAGRIIALSDFVTIGTSGVAALVILVFAPWMSARVLAAPQLVGLLRFSAIVIVLNAWAGAQAGALAGFEAFRAIARINLWSGLVTSGGMILGIWWRGLFGAVVAMIAAQGVTLAMNRRAMRTVSAEYGVPLSSAGWIREWRIIPSFSIPSMAAAVLLSLATWLSNAMLVNGVSGYVEMGIFNAANQWRTAILFVPQSVAAILLPVLASLQGQSDHRKYRKVLRHGIAVNGGLALAGAIPIVCVAPWIMGSYGSDFRRGTAVLTLLALVAVITAVSNVLGQSIVTAGWMWEQFALYVVAAASLAGAAWLLIPRLGAFGLALATLTSWVLFTVGQVVVNCRIGMGAGSRGGVDEAVMPTVRD